MLKNVKNDTRHIRKTAQSVKYNLEMTNIQGTDLSALCEEDPSYIQEHTNTPHTQKDAYVVAAAI